MLVLLCSLVIIIPLEHVRSLRIPLTPRQVIPIGLPFDVYDDIDRDTAAEELAMDCGKLSTNQNGVNLPKKPHFFQSTDCSMFASAQVCAEAFHRTTFLATYPCSGNTWTRSMFEQTLQIYTGSVFCDRSLKKYGFLGECHRDPSKVFLVKTHWPVAGYHTEGNGERNLVIVRDPLHAALSFTVWAHGGSDHHTEIPEHKLHKVFDRVAHDKLGAWKHMASVIRDRTDVHVVRYEDIVANTSHSYLTDIFPYVGVNPDNPDVIARLSRAIEFSNSAFNSTRRNHTYVFKFTDKHKQLARKIIGEDLAKHFGYVIS